MVLLRMEWWCGIDNQATEPFGTSTSTASLPVQPHCTDVWQNSCQEDLNSSSLENWRRPPGRPCTTWMKTIQQDLKSNNLSLNEAIHMAQNRPLWRLMSMFGAKHSYWCTACQKELFVISWETTEAKYTALITWHQTGNKINVNIKANFNLHLPIRKE